jgi:threonine/homoserine/homoserine lactone efflux protein
MSFDSWLLFCATEAVLCLTPGPAVLLVVSLALTRGAGAGLGASLGILTANAFYFALSATGIGAVLLASWELFFLIKWIGAAYLVWLGLRMLFARDSPLTQVGQEPGAKGARPVAAPFRHGVVTQGANPKALLFFTALLPQFIEPAGSVPLQVALLGASSIVIEVVALSFYVAVCHRARHVVAGPRLGRAFTRVGGGLLVWAGVRMAAIQRS